MWLIILRLADWMQPTDREITARHDALDTTTIFCDDWVFPAYIRMKERQHLVVVTREAAALLAADEAEAEAAADDIRQRDEADAAAAAM